LIVALVLIGCLRHFTAFWPVNSGIFSAHLRTWIVCLSVGDVMFFEL
jgi:hypothetical protein